MSYSVTQTATFNRSHARRVATKMGADLRRMQQIYGWPADSVIENLIAEVTELLALDYLKSVEIGFARNGQRVISLKYEARRDGTLSGDDNAGGVPRGVDISGCDRINFLTFNSRWSALTSAEQQAVEATLPYVRTGAPAPQDGTGSWTHDRTYSAAGSGTTRHTFRPLS